MVLTLRVLGWLGLISSAVRLVIKIGGNDAMLSRYVGSSRNLDTEVGVIAWSLVFLALAAILQELRAVKALNVNANAMREKTPKE